VIFRLGLTAKAVLEEVKKNYFPKSCDHYINLTLTILILNLDIRVLGNQLDQF
jgi:hypothetical protein